MGLATFDLVPLNTTLGYILVWICMVGCTIVPFVYLNNVVEQRHERFCHLEKMIEEIHEREKDVHKDRN